MKAIDVLSWAAQPRVDYIGHATPQNPARVALEAGNSLQMVFLHFRELLKPVDAQQQFAIKPVSQVMIVGSRINAPKLEVQ